MKKIFGMIVVLLCTLLVLTGCKGNNTKVFKYLKMQQNFVGNPSYNGGKYTVKFNVNDDLSYSLNISDQSGMYDELKDYSVEGTQMEYFGCHIEKYESTSWGITTHWKVYIHVIKFPEATIENHGTTLAFYLLAHCDSKHADTFTLELLPANSMYDESDISNIASSIYKGYAIKVA